MLNSRGHNKNVVRIWGGVLDGTEEGICVRHGDWSVGDEPGAEVMVKMAEGLSKVA